MARLVQDPNCIFSEIKREANENLRGISIVLLVVSPEHLKYARGI